MVKLIQICAVGLVSLFAATGIAHAQGSLHDELSESESSLPTRLDEPILLAQDRPALDGVISQLEGRYGPGQIKSVSDTFVGRDGRDYFTVKYLTADGQMIIVKVDANSGSIVGGG
jgi:hypothetical protein